MTAATHSEFSIKSNSYLKDIPTSPGLCFDKEKVHNSYKIINTSSLTYHSVSNSFRSLMNDSMRYTEMSVNLTKTSPGQTRNKYCRNSKLLLNKFSLIFIYDDISSTYIFIYYYYYHHYVVVVCDIYIYYVLFYYFSTLKVKHFIQMTH